MAGAPERLRLALAASFLSRAWAAGVSLLAVPLYLRYLGVEAYGVVGLFVSLSAIVGLLDLGLGATLTREMSRVPSGQAGVRDARDAARTFELVYLGLAVLVGLLGAALAYPLGMFWITVESLSRREVTEALILASLALACQWPGNLYAAGLAGLQRQVRLGFATAVLATTRVGLTLLAIWWIPSLHAFFAAQIVAGLLHTGVSRYLFCGALSLGRGRSTFRWQILRSSLSFAGGMIGIALTTIVLTQTDKIVLSRVLSLSEFGVYSVAAALATGLYLVISPLFSVMYPRFSALVHEGPQKEKELAHQYLAASQLIALLLMPVGVLMSAFGPEVLFVWTGDRALSVAGGLTLGLMVAGNAFNGLMNMPYALQLAYGWPRLALWVNVVSIILLVPGIFWAATRYGAVGGAATWALLNLGYLLVTPQIMHRRLLPSEKMTWYRSCILLPLVICVGLVISFAQVRLEGMSRLEVMAFLSAYWLLATFAISLVLTEPRRRIFAWWKIKRFL